MDAVAGQQEEPHVLYQSHSSLLRQAVMKRHPSTKATVAPAGTDTPKYLILGGKRQTLFVYYPPVTLGTCEWPKMKEKKVWNPLTTYQTSAWQEIRAL